VHVGTNYNITIAHSTIAFNDFIGASLVTLGNLLLTHTIIANHPLVNCLIVAESDTFLSNVDSDGTCFTSLGGNLLLVDPQLSPLADNGGQTPTHVFNNPLLLDAGDAAGSSCSGIDQRGFPRPVDFDGDGIARCDIGAIELGAVGIAILDPDTATVRKSKPFQLNYLWRVPPDENWHDIQTLDLRVRENGEVVFWVRWSESDDTFQLIDPRNAQPRGSAFPAGSNHVLETRAVALDLRDSSSTGSGPTGLEVTLHLALTFKHKSHRDEPFQIEVTGTNDAGDTQPFAAAGAIIVNAGKGH
jgi:hypothetical protein